MKNKIAVLMIVIIVLVVGITIYIISSTNKVTAGDDLLLQQQLIDDEIISREYAMDDDWTFEDPFIDVNPYDTNVLSAYIMFESDEDITYSYVVEGKTENVDFSYSTDEYSSGIVQIPVFGLYAYSENNVEVTITDENGSQTTETFIIDTTKEYVDPEVLTAQVSTYDDELFSDYMDGNFVYDNYGRFYDANGDIRGSALNYEGWYGYVKTLNDKLIITDKIGQESQFTTAYSVNPMGQYDQEFKLQAPDDYIFHHDGTYANGYYYMLTTPKDKSDIDNTLYEDSISVYDEEGNFVEQIDLGELGLVDLDGQVAANSNPQDVHFNSIDYYEPTNSLIISSRSYSSITSLSIDSHEIEWIIDDPETVSDDFSEYVLDVEDIDNFDFTSGNHTAFVANDYISDAEENHVYISVMDNNSCISEDGSEQTKGFAEEIPEDGCYSTGVSTSLVYDVDLENNSVSLYSKIETPATSAFRSSVYMTEENTQIYSATPGEFYVYDTEGNLVFEYAMATEGGATEHDPFTYRVRIVSSDAIGDLF